MTRFPKPKKEQVEGDELELVVEEIADLDMPTEEGGAVKGGSGGTHFPPAATARGAIAAQGC